MPNTIEIESAFEAAISSPSLTVIHFTAQWADQCPQVNDVLDTLAQHPEFSKVQFYECPAEELSELSLKYHIEAVPTVIFFLSGRQIDRVDGADVAQITEKVKQHNPTSEKLASVEDRLKSLINQAQVMLFMKGDRQTPRCGFSRKIVEILNETKVPYETFDILQDEDVRQGLKVYSDWPTYPQLYVKGELIGGLDIVKELLSNGDLVATLKGDEDN
ncbi:glutaredoxin-3 [Euwallacea fornicatus]|uniref:glutaredoxin-3 n=1 Tax=Euwallacea fornicatus TaxID=995702 RepID=UPI00338D9991